MLRTGRIGVALLAIALACACFQSNSTTPVGGSGCIGSSCGKSAGGHSGGVLGGTSGGSGGSTGGAGTSAGSGATSSGGSTGGPTTGSTGGSSGSSGGSTGAAALLACPNGPPAGCAAPICTTILDQGNDLPLSGALLSLVSPGGVPLTGAGTEYTSESDGSFFLCAPLNTPFYVEATAQDYQTAETGILDEPGGADIFFDYFTSFAVISTEDLSAFKGFLTSPPYIPGTSFVIVLVGGDPNGTCGFGVGYSVGAALPDGGTLADGGPLPFAVTYINGDFPDSTLTATTSTQTALLYNIDSTLTNGTIVVTAANPSFPASCVTELPAAWDMTGQVPVSDSSFSETGFPLP